VLLLLLATVRTTTTEVPRIVGEPLDSWVVLAAGAALLVVILVAGFVTQRRLSRSER
jgi:hypothetical protein